MLRLVVVLLALLLFPAAHADECDEAADQATLNQCADEAYKEADAELNALYRQIGQRLGDDPDAKARLLSAQRAWIAYRDAECAFAAGATSGGSIYPMIVAGCRDRLTRKRVEDFNAYLACEEGDMSCPVPAN